MTVTDRESRRPTDRGAAELFQLVVASVKDYAIFMLDRSGRVVTWNEGAALIKGYSADEVLGREISIFYTPEDVAQGRPQALLAAAISEGRVEDEGWRVRKDGSRFWASVVLTSICGADGALDGFVKVARDLNPEEFKWRTETYEFVSDRLAIDLLAGSSRYREIVEAGGNVDDWVRDWEEPLREFARRRDEFLLYR